jgi:hypothetical protein
MISIKDNSARHDKHNRSMISENLKTLQKHLNSYLFMNENHVKIKYVKLLRKADQLNHFREFRKSI